MLRNTSNISRRNFFLTTSKLLFTILAGYPLHSFALASPEEVPPPPEQKIMFFHTHTHERLTITHSPGQCTLDTRNQLDYFLRDFRTGEQHPIDTAILDTLYKVQDKLKGRGVFEVISGYRSAKTNQYLREKGSGVDLKSLHMSGQAIDIRLSGLHSQKLRDIAISLGIGGVGYYAKSDFVHLDTGNFRTW